MILGSWGDEGVEIVFWISKVNLFFLSKNLQTRVSFWRGLSSVGGWGDGGGGDGGRFIFFFLGGFLGSEFW